MKKSLKMMRNILQKSPSSKNKRLLLEVTYIDESKAECILSAIKKDVLPYIYGKDKRKKKLTLKWTNLF